MRLIYVIHCIQSIISYLPSFVQCGYNGDIVNKSENDNSDIYLDSFQLISKYNYPAEIHSVVTEDGYLLNIFRIPSNGPPVLLVHGIGDSSDSWLVLGPMRSLAYLLSDAGYDVWLFNTRGNRYSKTNMKRISKEQFWDFTFEEMGTKDIPATIDYILNFTPYSKLSYVGFSQGTTAFIIMCSMKPEYNEKINHAVLLAPVSWLTHTKYPLMSFWAHIFDELVNFSESAKVYEIPFNKVLNEYHVQVCNKTARYNVLCHLELYANFGLRNLSDLSPDRLPIITSHIPAGVSVKTFFHFIQLYVSKRFQRYDYGIQKNKKIYSSVKPPEYNVSLVTVPISMFVSEVDWFGDTDDADVLRRKLSNIEQFILINKSSAFTHLEFVYGSRVNSLINSPVINILNRVRKQRK